MTPLAMDSKCVRKESEATAFDQRLRRPRAPNQLQHQRKAGEQEREAHDHRRMNAMTWLRVSADMHEPMARKPPAISRLPR